MLQQKKPSRVGGWELAQDLLFGQGQTLPEVGVGARHAVPLLIYSKHNQKNIICKCRVNWEPATLESLAMNPSEKDLR